MTRFRTFAPAAALLLAGLVAFAALAAPALPARAAAPAVPEAAALLRSIVATYTGQPAFRMTFAQSYAPSGFPDAAPESGTLTIQAPHFLRFDYDGPEGKLYTFDGRTAHQYVAADRQVMRKTLTAAEKERLPLLFLKPPAEVLDRFAAVVKPDGKGLLELTLTPRGESELKSVSALATPSGELKRLVVLDAEENRTTFTFTKREPAKKRPLSDFDLVPPKGTRVVGD